MEFLANYNLFVQRAKLYRRGDLELLERKTVIPISKLQRNATSPMLRTKMFTVSLALTKTLWVSCPVVWDF